MPTTEELQSRHCGHQTVALGEKEIADYLAAVPGWRREGTRISRDFDFKNYYRTLAFVNAIAYVFHTEDHHPDLLVTYKRCTVTLYTHSVAGGLSENDFICAAKVDAVYKQGAEQA